MIVELPVSSLVKLTVRLLVDAPVDLPPDLPVTVSCVFIELPVTLLSCVMICLWNC